MDVRECYAAMGADYDDVMRRLGNEERVRKFLPMVLQDESFSALSADMEAGDGEKAFRSVHTLKGVCLNLGLKRLADSCGRLTENLRGGVLNDESAALFEQVKKDYDSTMEAIRELLNS